MVIQPYKRTSDTCCKKDEPHAKWSMSARKGQTIHVPISVRYLTWSNSYRQKVEWFLPWDGPENEGLILLGTKFQFGKIKMY